MPGSKSNFLDKVLGRIGRLDQEGLQSVVQRLARERNFLETLFNTIEDGILVVDENGRIIYFNQSVTRLLGLAPEATEGQSLERFLPELDWKKVLNFDHQGGQRVVRMELEVNFPRPRYLWLYAAPLDGEAAGSLGVALILHDATETRQKTFEAIESERVQALTLLAASVAHEIGNPLNALHIHLQLMERECKKLRALHEPAPMPATTAGRGRRKTGRTGARDEAGAEALTRLEKYLEVAKGEIGRLDYIITEFLQAMRPTAPQMKLGSLNEAVEATLALLQPELDNRGITVQLRLARHLSPVAHDPVQIKQVLVNLVKNAMQAMSQGGVLTLATGESGEEAWIEVRDTGGGIPKETLSRLFEPFFTTKKKGTGLGLMIVQRIVRGHGGRIEIESQAGQGSTFRVILPRHQRPPRLLEAPAVVETEAKPT
ncbi:MAG: ATP-binding protein [Verrucomicrobiae bacterium]|nr:ATP-binding protein [Verrucomicrobiae bacterium]